MGMYDKLHIKCSKCRKELEFQSKSGECMLSNYNRNTLTPMVAYGMNGDVIRCQFCNNRIKLICNIPIKVKVRLKSLGKRKGFDYEGNYNEKHPNSIKRQKELSKIFMRK